MTEVEKGYPQDEIYVKFAELESVVPVRHFSDILLVRSPDDVTMFNMARALPPDTAEHHENRKNVVEARKRLETRRLVPLTADDQCKFLFDYLHL